MLDDVPRATACELRFEIAPRFPQPRHVTKPKMRRLNIHRHLTDVMLHIRILNLVL